MFPCGSLGLRKDPSDASWLYMNIVYEQNYNDTGVDEVKIYITDDNNVSSSVITLQLAMLISPCYSNGECKCKSSHVP